MTSGNIYYYRQLALDTPGGGVGDAKVFPATPGPGGVRIVIVGEDMGPADAALVARCDAYIQPLRFVGSTVEVRSAGAKAVDVHAVLTLADGTMLQAVTEAFRASLGSYLREVAFRGSTVLYNQIHSRLLGVEGVVDFTGLTVNGGVGNVALGAEEVPVVGALDLEVGT